MWRKSFPGKSKGCLRQSAKITCPNGRDGGHESNPAPINRKMTRSFGQGYNED